MPIYEYQCGNCGVEFEEWQNISDAPVDKCPQCGGPSSRLISQSTFILKGTGWYATDYAKKDGNSHGKSSRAAESSSSEKSSSGSKDASSDSKTSAAKSSDGSDS